MRDDDDPNIDTSMIGGKVKMSGGKVIEGKASIGDVPEASANDRVSVRVKNAEEHRVWTQFYLAALQGGASPLDAGPMADLSLSEWRTRAPEDPEWRDPLDDRSPGRQRDPLAGGVEEGRTDTYDPLG